MFDLKRYKRLFLEPIGLWEGILSLATLGFSQTVKKPGSTRY